MSITTNAILFISMIYAWPPSNALFKMTNLKCESYNTSWVEFKECRLRAVNRETTFMNLVVDFKQAASDIHVQGQVVKKALGGYKPFVLKFDVDACVFVVRRNNPVAGLVYRLFKDFSNINHSCPYEGLQILKDFYLQHELVTLPMPEGEYGLLLTWTLHKVKTFITNVYFSFLPSGTK